MSTPPPRAPYEALTEETLGLFLDAFYAKVRCDAVIGPVFAARIADGDWPRHLAKIRDFWSSVLLKSGRYKGNPFGKHQAIGGLGLAHFERWLGLFSQTAAEAFAPEIAAILSERANRIGDSLKAGLFFRPELLRANP
ncbi:MULTISPECIES: group III truncated hemoglobin [Methylobacterium]|uniref:Group 3 truncated hemoglobin ctb n=1 Tax=Methylobacterium thuringiense TaxID=1003091 RepID=A0ABQ4TNV7_9HYPH|nr:MULTISPECIES: group III truncated hemoglobin [Methylobacterium]GJE55999.1 Group 3 truncated hemoglobin ctb [Methylobacterium thuringiense]